MLHSYSRAVALAVTLFFLSLMGASPLRAQALTATMFQQPPCTYTNGVCAQFSSTLPASFLVRGYSFNLPGPGRIQVSFDGSMNCSNRNFDTSTSFGVIDLSSQILTTNAQTASYAGPSGQRIAARIVPAIAQFATVDYSIPINLHSTRVLAYPTGGLKGVFFKFARNRIDSGVECLIFSAAFTVVYLR